MFQGLMAGSSAAPSGTDGVREGSEPPHSLDGSQGRALRKASQEAASRGTECCPFWQPSVPRQPSRGTDGVRVRTCDDDPASRHYALKQSGTSSVLSSAGPPCQNAELPPPAAPPLPLPPQEHFFTCFSAQKNSRHFFPVRLPPLPSPQERSRKLLTWQGSLAVGLPIFSKEPPPPLSAVALAIFFLNPDPIFLNS